MRLNFIRRRRSPESFRREVREVHNQPRPKVRNPQGQKQKGIQWFSIPLSVGIGVVGLVQMYKSYRTSSSARDENGDGSQRQQKRERAEIQDEDSMKRPKRRARIRPDGPW